MRPLTDGGCNDGSRSDPTTPHATRPEAAGVSGGAAPLTAARDGGCSGCGVPAPVGGVRFDLIFQVMGRAMRVQEPAVRADLVWTVPNVLSVIGCRPSAEGGRWSPRPRRSRPRPGPRRDQRRLRRHAGASLEPGCRVGRSAHLIADRLSTVTVLVVFLIRDVLAAGSWPLAPRDAAPTVEMGRGEGPGNSTGPAGQLHRQGRNLQPDALLPPPALGCRGPVVEQAWRASPARRSRCGAPGLQRLVYIRQTREVLALMPVACRA